MTNTIETTIIKDKPKKPLKEGLGDFMWSAAEILCGGIWGYAACTKNLPLWAQLGDMYVAVHFLNKGLSGVTDQVTANALNDPYLEKLRTLDLVSNRETPLQKPGMVEPFEGKPFMTITDKKPAQHKSAKHEYVMAGVNLVGVGITLAIADKIPDSHETSQFIAGCFLGNFIGNADKRLRKGVLSGALADPYLKKLAQADFITGRTTSLKPADAKFLETCVPS